MSQINYRQIIKTFSAELPRFADGRIDYTESDTAPVLICFVKYEKKLLLLQRSDKVKTYHGRWNTVAGYIDEDKPLLEKAKEELFEELGLDLELIINAKEGKPYQFTDDNIKITWIIFPILVELKTKPEIELDWEHTQYRWVNPERLPDYNTIPNLIKSYNSF